MDPIPSLIAFLETTQLINVTCQREYDPPRVAIVTVGSIEVDVNYNDYQRIRQALNLSDDVCAGNDSGFE